VLATVISGLPRKLPVVTPASLHPL